jgi:hypothetical protein
MCVLNYAQTYTTGSGDVVGNGNGNTLQVTSPAPTVPSAPATVQVPTTEGSSELPNYPTIPTEMNDVYSTMGYVRRRRC